MANVGSFKKAGGEIVTLSVQTRNVRIVPETDRANDSAPSHRVRELLLHDSLVWNRLGECAQFVR